MLLLLLTVLTPVARAGGFDYRFSVPEARVTVYIEKSGSALIHYRIKFRCARNGKPIDIVDIGMPSKSHRAIGAKLNGVAVPRHQIMISKYVQNAYETHLPESIGPEKEGVFEFTARSHDMVWQDTTDPAQASFRFTPTWFDSSLLIGKTALTLVYVLPIPANDLGKVTNRILYHRKSEAGWKKGLSADGKLAAVVWKRKVSLDRKSVFGVSFPKNYVEKVLARTILDDFMDWWRTSPRLQVLSGLLLAAAFGLGFFLGTRGTGCGLWGLLTLGMIGGMIWSPIFHLCMYPLVGSLVVIAWWARRRGRKHYFPAELCREGGGIKRGLTAVEAGVLLELPLNKLLTMVVFGMARKGFIRITHAHSLRLKVRVKKNPSGVWLLPGDAPAKVWAYEPGFIHAFRSQDQKRVEDMRLHHPIGLLIEGVAQRMRGFDLEDTRDYYRQIVHRAWKQIRAETDYEVRFAQVDRSIEWLMLGGGWDEDMRDLEEEDGHRYAPWWYEGGRPGVYSLPVAGSEPSGNVFSDTSFADVANSVTGRLETLSRSLAGAPDSAISSRGTVDLSAIDRFTDDALSVLAVQGGDNSGGGDGGGFTGGGFSSCACACAGCACACACAGGGR